MTLIHYKKEQAKFLGGQTNFFRGSMFLGRAGHVLASELNRESNQYHNCDQIWENPPYGIFVKIKFAQATLKLTLSPIVHFVLETEHLLYDHAGTIEIEKVWSKGIATYPPHPPHL